MKSKTLKILVFLKDRKALIIRSIYLAVITSISIFLLGLGSEPWLLIIENWPLFLILVTTTGTGLIIQARSFIAVATDRNSLPNLKTIIEIWSASSVVSVVAPFFAGIATRTTLLIQNGMSVNSCLSTSFRQVWMGLEYALLTASITLQATNITHGPSLSLSMAFVWLSAMLLRTNSRKAERFQNWPRRAKDAFSTLGKTISIRAQVWFILQILSMTATYYFAFNLMGAELTTNEALALSAITILASVLMFVPNGLGITDSLWFFIAINRGLTVETAAALAIMIRLSHLTSSLIIYLAGKLKLSSIKLDN